MPGCGSSSSFTPRPSSRLCLLISFVRGEERCFKPAAGVRGFRLIFKCKLVETPPFPPTPRCSTVSKLSPPKQDKLRLLSQSDASTRGNQSSRTHTITPIPAPPPAVPPEPTRGKPRASRVLAPPPVKLPEGRSPKPDRPLRPAALPGTRGTARRADAAQHGDTHGCRPAPYGHGTQHRALRKRPGAALPCGEEPGGGGRTGTRPRRRLRDGGRVGTAGFIAAAGLREAPRCVKPSGIAARGAVRWSEPSNANEE